METIEIRKLAVSRAGHEAGRIYAVVGEDEENVWLCDGTHRKLDHPKKKNKKHIQLILHFSKEMQELLSGIVNDEELSFALISYRNRIVED